MKANLVLLLPLLAAACERAPRVPRAEAAPATRVAPPSPTVSPLAAPAPAPAWAPSYRAAAASDIRDWEFFPSLGLQVVRSGRAPRHLCGAAASQQFAEWRELLADRTVSCADLPDRRVRCTATSGLTTLHVILAEVKSGLIVLGAAEVVPAKASKRSDFGVLQSRLGDKAPGC